MAVIATLKDPFHGSTYDSSLWAEFLAGSATSQYDQSGAQYNYPASSTSSTDGDVSSNSTYDLTSSEAFFEVLTVPSSSTAANGEIRIYTDANNWFRWVYEAGTIYAQRKKAGTAATVFSVAYSATTHRWWRIAESGGTVTWYTSTDGLSWTSRGTYVHGMTITAMKALLAATCYQNETSPGAFKFRNFNTTGKGIVFNQHSRRNILTRR